MTSPSSAKKIERIQRAGTTRVAGTRRPLGFPLAILAVILFGSLAVFFARDSRINAASADPQQGANWRAAFDVYNCDKYLSNITNSSSTSNLSGIEWGAGFISVNPTTPASTGKNATMGKFFDRVGISFSEGTNGTVATLSEGTKLDPSKNCTVTEGEDKGKEKASELVLYLWPPKSSDKTDPEIIRSNFGDTKIVEDREIFALALVPKGTKTIPLPSVDAMNAETDSTTSTTVPADGGAGSTVAPETTVAITTTAPPK